MGMQQILSQTLERMAALRKDAPAGLNTGSGLTYYDLEREAKLLYPVLAPIRKRMARVGLRPGQQGSGLACHWNIVTNPNSGNVIASVSEGKRGGTLTPATAPKISTYKGIGLENVVTWEAEYASEGYDDLRALAQRTSLDSLILAEEPMLLWGNSGTSGVGLQFHQTPKPAGTQQESEGSPTTTGSLASAATYYLYCVALSHMGWVQATAAGKVVPTVVRRNADWSTDTIPAGAAQISAASNAITVTSADSVGSIVATVEAVPGAAGYAWFLGASAGAGNAFFAGVTTLNTTVLTAVPADTEQAANYTGSGNDYSFNPLAFDGLIPQALASNGYFKSLDGAPLTGDGANGIVEINAVLKYMWDTYKISPTRMYGGSGVVDSIVKIALSSASNAGFLIMLQNAVDSVGNLVIGTAVAQYVNRFAFGGAKPIPLEIHPNMPDGHLFFDLEVNPYPTANIAQARCVRTRRDYFQVIWPIRTRQYENGIYGDECLQVYVPYGMALISNIG